MNTLLKRLVVVTVLAFGGVYMTPTSITSVHAELNKKPPKGEIVTTLSKVSVEKCSALDPSLKGVVKVKIKAVSSGEIISAQVVNAPYKGSAVGNCIEKEVLAQKLSQFSTPSIQFTFPFKL